MDKLVTDSQNPVGQIAQKNCHDDMVVSCPSSVSRSIR